MKVMNIDVNISATQKSMNPVALASAANLTGAPTHEMRRLKWIYLHQHAKQHFLTDLRPLKQSKSPEPKSGVDIRSRARLLKEATSELYFLRRRSR